MQGLSGQNSLSRQSILLALVFSPLFSSSLEVASEHFKCSKNKTEGENKLLWNVAES